MTSCGCCSGSTAPSADGVRNRPGMTAISYRSGTHPEFFDTMVAGLSRADRPALGKLTTRQPDDFTIALLDSWAMVSDVLAFYEERLANESFLRTALDRLSIQELGKLIGYQLAPGAAAETHLAFSVERSPNIPGTLSRDPGSSPIQPPTAVELEPGLRVQSIPGPGEEPQTFETVDSIVARPEWNAITATTTKSAAPGTGSTEAWLSGIALNLRKGDPLLFLNSDGSLGNANLRMIESVTEDQGANRTRVTWSDGLSGLSTSAGPPHVYLMRKALSVFGHNAPAPELVGETSWSFRLAPSGNGADLDGSHPDVVKNSLVVLRNSWGTVRAWRVNSVRELSRTAYAISGRVTRITIVGGTNFASFQTNVRGTIVFAVSERLDLTDPPDSEAVATDVVVDLDVSGMEVGRKIIVAGNDNLGSPRSEVTGVKTVTPVGSRWKLQLDPPLAHSYDRTTVVVYGNVALATHGESVSEILGPGRASEPFQQFTLKQAPLTYVQSTDPSGVSTTLEVRVNGVRWNETPTLYQSDGDDHLYSVRLDEEGNRTIRFGDGVKGARLPTGSPNIRAHYRKGIGSAGNVDADALAQLIDRPLGVKGVVNPASAAGGVDAETDEAARENMPLKVRTLGRAVSLLDYEDYARAFSGVSKAHAAVLNLVGGRTILVTVAFTSGVVSDPGARIATLTDSLKQFGDPRVQVIILAHQEATFRLALKATIDPAYESDAVLGGVKAVLIDSFSFPNRDFVEPVHLSGIVTAAHRVPGLVAVDLDALYIGAAAVTSPPLDQRLLAQQPAVDSDGNPIPAGLLLIHPDPFDYLEVAP